MVRIIQEENTVQKAPITVEKPLELSYKHHLVLNVIGLAVAEAPEKLQQLLENYSIELSRDCPEEELTDTLILAIGECDEDFNRDLASLILDRTLTNAHDQYDFKQLAGQAANVLTAVGNSNAANPDNGSILGGLTGTIGQIGGILNQGIQAVQTQSASEKAKEGILAYRKQQQEQTEAEESKKNNLILVFLLMALGLSVIGFLAYLKRKAQPIIQSS